MIENMEQFKKLAASVRGVKFKIKVLGGGGREYQAWYSSSTKSYILFCELAFDEYTLTEKALIKKLGLIEAFKKSKVVKLR